MPANVSVSFNVESGGDAGGGKGAKKGGKKKGGSFQTVSAVFRVGSPECVDPAICIHCSSHFYLQKMIL